ncbi:MAG TPA: hypothetical protein DEO86_08335 [Colwellia sp.]|nr:hypothetical protein [Colwellia sp.]|tara:strand:+ start:5664 stop:7724 length:2061 start_codon:yes stop_codon:yes gene_type:complete
MKLNPNNTALDLPEGFNARLIPLKENLAKHLKHQNYNKLNKIIISMPKNREKSFFGDDRWNISPYWHKQSNLEKIHIDFTFLKENEKLQLELKFISYGWIFHKSGRKTKPAKIQTVWNRISSFKKVYRFLSMNGHTSIAAFKDKNVWQNFLDFIKDEEYSKSSLVEMFVAFSRVRDLEQWLEKSFELPSFKANQLAKKLSTKEENQTLSIPGRIADIIYGKAIALVEECYPYKKELGLIEALIQKNYREGQKTVDRKIASGIYTFISSPQDKQYAREVNNHQPQKISDIISNNINGLSNLPIGSNGTDWASFSSELMTACFICCDAFSGMRNSELNEMEVNASFNETHEKFEFNFIGSKEHKLHNGKRMSWVCAPISHKAIKIVQEFVRDMGQQLTSRNHDFKNNIWLTQKSRSKLPRLITGWNTRLQNFSKNANAIITEEDLQEAKLSNPNSKGSIIKYVIPGTYWHFTTHQCRRTLAVFASANRLSSPVAIKQQYKHLYLQMAEWYGEGAKELKKKLLVSDPEFQQLLAEVKLESSTNKFYNWFNTDTKLGGTGGKAIMDIRQDAPTIYSDWNTLYKAIKSKRLTLHSSLHSHCRNGYNCDMEGAINPAFCVSCSSDGSIIEEEQAISWQTKHKRLTEYFTDNSNISFQEKLPFILQIQAAEQVMKDFKIHYEPFPELIEVSIQ